MQRRQPDDMARYASHGPGCIARKMLRNAVAWVYSCTNAHPARLDGGAAFQTLQPGDLVALRRNDLLQLRVLAKQVHHLSFQQGAPVQSSSDQGGFLMPGLGVWSLLYSRLS